MAIEQRETQTQAYLISGVTLLLLVGGLYWMYKQSSK
jgi:LPXTG-motif cell wall-anchored protein